MYGLQSVAPVLAVASWPAAIQWMETCESKTVWEVLPC